MKRARIQITACFVVCPYCDTAFVPASEASEQHPRTGWTDIDLVEAPDELKCGGCGRMVEFPKRGRK